MAVIKKGFGTLLVAGAAAFGLLALSAGSVAQETPTKEKSGKTQTSAKSGKETVTAHLSGDKQVPPVQTKASGKSTIKVDDDKSVSGKVMIEDMTTTAAHIHQGAPDKDGPVIIPLEKTSDTTFSVPAKTKLTDDQFAAFKEGNLYINVHSKKYPSGEIRAQMKP